MLLQEVTSFVAVLLTAVCIASAVSFLYAFGLRLWARADSGANAGAAVPGRVAAVGSAHAPSHIMTRLASAVCFAACVAIVLFALWLMIPLFH